MRSKIIKISMIFFSFNFHLNGNYESDDKDISLLDFSLIIISIMIFTEIHDNYST